MAKYKFDFSSFTVADVVAVLEISRRESPSESCFTTRLLHPFESEEAGLPQQKDVDTLISVLNFAGRFADGYSLDDVLIEDLAVFCQDFVDAYEAFEETINNSQTPSPAAQ